jgi:DNA-directed RNA polymerase subunit K/omega
MRLAAEPYFGYPVGIMPDIHDLEDEQIDVESSEPAVPITSRFLFVDVAAQRAKQLRRGALARLDRASATSPHKLERVAMEEVRSGLVHYTLPGNFEGPGGKARD